MNLATKLVSAIVGVSIAIIVLGSVPLQADVIPDRRKDQFPDEPGYLIVPLPYSFPGIGTGWLALANVQNMFGTHADLFAIYAVGDAEGKVALLDDMHLLSERLILSVTYQDLDKLVIQNYETRGMDTEKDDFNFIEINKAQSREVSLTLTFFDRRFEIFAGQSEGAFDVPRIRNSDGDIIAEFDKPFHGEQESKRSGLLFDFTDDLQDPRRGVRFRVTRSDNPRTSEDEADYFTLDYDALFYVPVGAINTWVFYYFRSDAVVTDEGNTDEQAISAEIGFDCDQISAGTAQDDCLQAEQEIVEFFVAQRKYGDATGLGGLERLRSYPSNRFNGAHTEFYGTEFRWNLTEEATPFDYFIWKDTRTGLQIAFFGETGTVAETTGELWKRSRSSYGAGFRLVTASGSVYRFDLATGDEGAQTSLWFFYPWN